MHFCELFMIAVGLSMDAFAVSVCKGLSVKRAGVKQAAAAGIYFGGFQALMPLVGYFFGSSFQAAIMDFDHWIAFALLLMIGGHMVKESREEESGINGSFGFSEMFPLAVATSIDALAVGVTFAFLKVDIVPAVLLIGTTTFFLSGAGIKIGNTFGAKYKSKAELTGGIILVLIGTKILVEHLGLFSF